MSAGSTSKKGTLPLYLQTYESMSDEQLVCLYLERSKNCHAVFSVLIKRYQGKVYRLSRRMGLDREDSRGISQAVFFQVHKNLESFQGKSKFSTWLFTIARNRSRNWINRLSRIRRTDREANMSLGPVVSPETMLIQHEEAKLVQKVIVNLPNKYREPLILFYFDNQSYDQIAEALKLPLRTVETRLYRARKIFKSSFIFLQQRCL